MPDHVDFVEVEEVVDGLDVGELPAELEVDDKVESHYQQGVAEEPENLEDGLLNLNKHIPASDAADLTKKQFLCFILMNISST